MGKENRKETTGLFFFSALPNKRRVVIDIKGRSISLLLHLEDLSGWLDHLA